MGQVIVMRAIPGSGKSTMAKQLANKAQTEESSLPPWWNKESFVSKTSPTGDPLFEKDMLSAEPKKASKIDRLVKQANFYYLLALD